MTANDDRPVSLPAWAVGDLLMAATCGAHCPWDAVADAYREARRALLALPIEAGGKA